MVAPATKGGCCRRQHLYWRRRRRIPPTQWYFITTLGGALKLSGRRQPVPDRTLAAQGRKPRRLPQPSARRAVNLRDYSQAPPSLPKARIIKYRTQQKSTSHQTSAFSLISSFLSSRAASSQVLSAFVSLTTVFGMGTGVSSQLSPLNL